MVFCALAESFIFYLHLINTNKHFWCHCRGHNWRKGLDHQHTTSFSRITPILLNCGIRQDNRCRFDLPSSFHKKDMKEPRVPEHSKIHQHWNPTISQVCIDIYIFSNHVLMGEEGQRHKNSNHISSDRNKCCTTHKFYLVGHGVFDQER